MKVTVRVVYLADDTIQEATFEGARVSTQLFARDQADHRGCRAVVAIYDNNGHKVRLWHGACVFTIDKTWEPS